MLEQRSPGNGGNSRRVNLCVHFFFFFVAGRQVSRNTMQSVNKDIPLRCQWNQYPRLPPLINVRVEEVE